MIYTSNFLFILAIIVLAFSLLSQSKTIYIIITLLLLIIAMFLLFYEQIYTKKKIKYLNKKRDENIDSISSLRKELTEKKEKVKELQEK
ncbi:unnamed protein product, partial [marine sediment metagenome]